MHTSALQAGQPGGRRKSRGNYSHLLGLVGGSRQAKGSLRQGATLSQNVRPTNSQSIGVKEFRFSPVEFEVLMCGGICEFFCGEFPWKLRDENQRKISPIFCRIFHQSPCKFHPKIPPEFRSGGRIKNAFCDPTLKMCKNTLYPPHGYN